jgi:serine/threonine protein kinase/formylglycine-generating enzyme required for sulfatase activity
VSRESEPEPAPELELEAGAGPGRAPLLAALRQVLSEGLSGRSPTVTPAPAEPGPERPASDFVRSLARFRSPSPRYELLRLLGQGGMGVVHEAFDRALQRRLAHKRVRPRRTGFELRADEAQEQALARFLDEAQVMAQLDHPGIVPVHDLGLDDQGRAFFTMRLVEGQEFEHVLTEARAGHPAWSRERLLEILIKVCDAVGYAHTRQVIHRDLKPANVMVGRFGEVYVVDWGLARVLDLHADAASHVRRARPHSLRRAVRENAQRDDPPSGGDSSHSGSGSTPLDTEFGSVIGTPAYMPPEQAAGDSERLGPQVDVYAVGAMLYRLLSGSAPYADRGRPASSEQSVLRVLEGPPTPLRRTAPDAPPELVAICERAMAREPLQRFASLLELGDELRAFIELRVVRSHRRGPLAELRKWVQRNRLTALALALAALVSLTALGGLALTQRDAAAAARDGERRVRGLLVAAGPEGMLARLDTLRIAPAGIPGLERWLAEAEGVAREQDAVRRRYETLVARLGPGRPPAELRRELEGAERTLAALAELRADRARELERGPADLDRRDALQRELAVLDWSLPRRTERLERQREWLSTQCELEAEASEEQRERAELGLACAQFARLAHPRFGALARVRGWLERAESLAAESTLGHAAAWEQACAAIAGSAAYGGLALEPQLGLVPLRADPVSGLWEFWHVLSGERPEADPAGGWQIGADTGLVLVLLPGGRFEFGAATDDPEAHAEERPARTIELAPFFLSRYEWTQGQWERATGTAPSRHFVDFDVLGEGRIGPDHPVEQVTWLEAQAVLARLGLQLPTEAQWEYAARGGGAGPYGAAPDFAALAASLQHFDLEYTTLPDGRVVPHGPVDGHVVHAPVQRTETNPFGLQGLLGNVREWARDGFELRLDEATVRGADGELVPRRAPLGRAIRGGGYRSLPSGCRVSVRDYADPRLGEQEVGLRAARALD